MPIRNLNSLKHFGLFLLLAAGISKGWAAEPLMAKISAGYSHTLAIDQAGVVYGWGSNEFGQTGDGTTVQRTQPVAVNAISGKVSQVATGDVHSLALLADGTVLAWGFNGYGQLGDNTNTLSLTPVPTTTTQLSTSVPPVTTTVALSGVLALSAGLYHSLALKNDGSLLSWGINTSGQLGINTIVNAKQATVISIPTGLSMMAIASGHNHNLALRSDGAVYAWGANEFGQLGDGKTKNLPIPTQITTLFSNIVAIAAGAKHSLALRHDGTVWAWGGNNAGQLGDATSTTRLTPVHVSVLTGIIAIAANGEHSLALDNNGNVWAWGNNETGQLGDGSTSSQSTPKQIKNLSGVHAISAGTAHSAAILDAGDGRTLTWGSNWQGQLGNGKPNRSFSGLPAVIANIDLASTALPPVFGIAAGDSHTLVVGPSGSVAYGWGGNEFGQVGDGTMVIKNTPVAVSNLPRISNWLAAGDVHSLALLPDGTVRA